MLVKVSSLAAAACLFLGTQVPTTDARLTAGLSYPEHSNLSQEKQQARRGKDTYCPSPVDKQKVVFPNSLVGRAHADDFEMYSGYVNVTEQDWLFYWFFETADSDPEAPLIIWTNGGPGCSSMEAATTENSPLTLLNIKEACSTSESAGCDYSQQLSRNPNSWNAHANVLYLDQPRYVGYSFGSGEAIRSSEEAAQDVITFYRGWLDLFPQFRGRQLIVSGESYAGHYVPAWTGAILDFNEQQSDPSEKIPLAGVVIGNGAVNNTVQNDETYLQFLRQENLIPPDSQPRSKAIANMEMVNYLGYSPNYYDYRSEKIQCPACYSYNYTAWAGWLLKEEVTEALGVCGDAGVDAFAGSAGGCISMGLFDANDHFDYSGALGRALDLGVPVTLYYGKSDTACDYVGGYAMANALEWDGQQEFTALELDRVTLAGVEVGQSKSSGGLTWLQIESAGHMVPIDQPATSSLAINTVLDVLRESRQKQQ